MKKIYFILGAIAITSLFLISATQLAERTSIPTIGEKAPVFKAMSTKGEITFPTDYYGKWKILFSHPGDFTPVCTSEMMALAQSQKEFDKLNCQIVGISVDGLNSHHEWVRSINEINFDGTDRNDIDFPIVSDKDLDVLELYGMMHRSSNSTRAIRGVYIIDPDDEIRMIMFYPGSTGRNTEELKRILLGLQTSDKHNVATPADWNPGDYVMIPPDTDNRADLKYTDYEGSEFYCPVWYMCMKKL